MVRERKRLQLNFKRSKYGRFILPLTRFSESFDFDLHVVNELTDRDVRVTNEIDSVHEHIISGLDVVKMNMNKNVR